MKCVFPLIGKISEGLAFLNNTAVLAMVIPISKIKSIDVPDSAQRKT